MERATWCSDDVRGTRREREWKTCRQKSHRQNFECTRAHRHTQTLIICSQNAVFFSLLSLEWKHVLFVISTGGHTWLQQAHPWMCGMMRRGTYRARRKHKLSRRGAGSGCWPLQRQGSGADTWSNGLPAIYSSCWCRWLCRQTASLARSPRQRAGEGGTGSRVRAVQRDAHAADNVDELVDIKATRE